MPGSTTALQSWIVEHDPLRIVRLNDSIVDSLGYPARSTYAETYWLPLLGPSALWALRRISGWLDAERDGLELELADLARDLGLGGRVGRNSAVVHMLARLTVFGMAERRGEALAVRRIVPPLPRRHALRLPPRLAELHAREVSATGVDRCRDGQRPAVNAPPPPALTAETERAGTAFGEVAAPPAPVPHTHDQHASRR